MRTTLPRPLRGIIPPLATPLLEQEKLDLDGAERLVENVVRAGVTGIFVLGTTGEAPSLSHSLRPKFVSHVCSVVEERIPVLVNVTDTCMAETVRMAMHAADVGASGLVLAPPYYFRLSQEELLKYLERLTPELPLPVYLYNYPDLTKNYYSPETVVAAAELPNIYGLKDSSGDMEYLATVIRMLSDRPDFAVLCGPEELLSHAISLGAHGGVTGGANLWPELYVDLYQSAIAGDVARVSELDRIVRDISLRVYNITPDGSSYIRGLKAALSIAGYCRNVVAEPYAPYGASHMQEIQSALVASGLPCCSPAGD